MSRTDSEGFSTKVTFLGKGWGLRVLKRGVVVMQGFVREKRLIGPALQSLLRWVDKLGYDSPMASASRDRNYCSKKEKP